MARSKPTVKHAPIVLAFAERLKGIRLARRMTQRDLADKAHVTFSYISRLEAGGAAPGIDLVEKLALALGARLGDLLPPEPTESSSSRREKAKGLFEAVVAKAGPESLGMVEVFLARIAESQSLNR